MFIEVEIIFEIGNLGNGNLPNRVFGTGSAISHLIGYDHGPGSLH